ncbi:hypothetical protein [Fibrobacter sp. UWB13]|uniref:hypothetical protein n=1 Tax=Fibrobacter sp. UWB13 TaxID=1896204 RepID=UPI0020CB471A|nr:hypothetical protein [Fibrobacter sp. UWB13]
MPSDDMLMYFEKHIIAPAEEECGYGIYSKALEIPIFFVSEKTINQKGLAIDCGVSDDLRKLHDIVDEDRFWKLETALVDRGDPIGLYLPKGEFQDQGPEIWVSYEKIRNQHQKWQDSKYTTALTLVHELGHAIMDAPTSGLYCLKTWVEEPLANMIALYYLDSVGPSTTNGFDRMEYVTDFVKTQSANYALGLNLFRSNRVFDWKAWKNAKWLLCFKIDALLDWVEYIKGNLGNVDDLRLEALFREIVRQPIEFNQTLLQQAEKLYEK